MNELGRMIRERIRESGSLSFYQFQEYCLYHPQYGYYTNTRKKIGKEGDFYTSPAVHPVFGETIAQYLYKQWKAIGEPSCYTVVEFGAGTGSLAYDILREVSRGWEIPFAQGFHYCICETSPYLRNVQAEKLKEFPVRWVDSPQEIAPFDGCVLSNELIDAFPVHRVKRTKAGLKEVYITEEKGRLIETLDDLSDERIPGYITSYALPPIVGQQMEVNLDALSWLENTAQSLRKGHIITIDYGFSADLLYHPSRSKGTMRGFRQHQIVEDLLQSPGEIDLTHDVNFTALMKHGELLGLVPCFFGSQAEFLVQAGILERLSEDIGGDPFRDETSKRNRAIKHLILPGALGNAFKVLVQQKVTKG